MLNFNIFIIVYQYTECRIPFIYKEWRKLNQSLSKWEKKEEEFIKFKSF